MTDPTPELQFDRAELGGGPPAAAACSRCQQAIAGSYFEVNGRVTCERCRQQLEAEWHHGSGVGRFVRAVLFGSIAAVLGAALYYAVVRITHFEIGLISIVVGIMVGIGVRTGSRGRGGLLYQALAVFLTYSSIVSTYSPYVLKGLMEGAKKAEGQSADATKPAAPIAAPGETTKSESAPAPAAPKEAASLLQILVAVVLLVVIIYASPFLALAGGLEAIMGLVIIGIGVWQAAKINAKGGFQVTGPYSIKAPPSLTEPPSAA